MLVYGDRVRPVDSAECLRGLMALVAAEAGGMAREDRLIHALVEAGEFAQGAIDAEFQDRGHDDLTPLHAACLEAVSAIARQAIGWPPVGPARAMLALADLETGPLPRKVGCKTPEGFAFYAVYPRACAMAAARRPSSQPLVIGLRSIGTTLAAAAAVGAGGAAALTLRPCGHPFRREVRVSQELRRRLAGHAGAFIVADEGPGLSGSSFAAAADLLEDLGVTEDRVLCLPSHHGGPGPQAAARNRARWARARRSVVTFDDLGAERLLRRWFEDLVGPILQITDLSGGAWRSDLPIAKWPPAWRAHEPRKFRLTTASGAYMARFAGLGRYGETKLARARLLHARGFAPEPIGLCGGFLLERWADGAPLTLLPGERALFLSWLGRYLGLRARAWPAEPWEGADPERLCEMARTNVEALDGRELADALMPSLRGLSAPQRLRPVHVDGRLHAWAWRKTDEGGFCKTDALDHSSGHDLIGCQDIAWDIAGAASEFELSQSETASLSRLVADASGNPVDPTAVEAFQVCYDAFQAAAWSMAAEDPAEAGRAGARRDFHLRRLRRQAFR